MMFSTPTTAPKKDTKKSKKSKLADLGVIAGTVGAAALSKPKKKYDVLQAYTATHGGGTPKMSGGGSKASVSSAKYGGGGALSNPSVGAGGSQFSTLIKKRQRRGRSTAQGGSPLR